MHSTQPSLKRTAPTGALTVAVIIPTKNRPQDLEDAVKTLLTQTVAAKELIIIDQSDHSESERRVKALFDAEQPSMKLNYIFDPSISGVAEARNRAMELLSSELMLFLDDDVLLEDDFIEQLIDSYRICPNAGGISGIITNYPPPPPATRAWRSLFMRGPFHDSRQDIYWKADSLRQADPIRVYSLGGGLMSYLTNVVGNNRFDEDMRGVCDGEDVDFSYRLNAELRIAPRARLVHNPSPIGRLKDHFLRRHARAQYFLYFKNWNHGLVNRLAFAWLNVGYAVIACFGALRRLSLEPWRAFLAGIEDASAIFTDRRSAGKH